MKRKKAFLTILILTALTAGVVLIQGCTQTKTGQTAGTTNTANQSEARTPPPLQKNSNHVPAHYDSPPEPADLRPVLAASQFTGKAREAYAAVKEIPATIAQLPCYCHCDRGMGHKSLHSCFEDDHAAHCAVCVDEALLAYSLTKKGRSANEIRELIIAQYAN